MRMMSTSRTAIAIAAIAGMAAATGHAQGTRQGQGSAARAQGEGSEATVAPIADTYFTMPVPAADQAYAAIDGKHLHSYVVEQSGISRRYRDQGHPQFWGRIIGTSSDTESAQWLIEKFKQIGLTDTKIQPVDLAPQWMPQSWEMTASAGEKTLRLDGSAQPAYGTPGTRPEG